MIRLSPVSLFPKSRAAKNARHGKGDPHVGTGRERFSLKPSSWWFLLGLAATLFFVVAHGAHDKMSGAGWRQAVMPGCIVVAQCGILSACHSWLRSRHTGAFLLVGALVGSLSGLAFSALHTDSPLSFPRIGGVLVGFSFWGLWALVFRLPEFLQEARLRVLEADEQRREFELARLRSSLHPHFLLNTLNAIAALVVDEPEVARRLVVALGDLLRDAMDPGPETRALSEDMDWLRRYAAILEIRHVGLHFAWDLDDGALSASLPRLLLQPLVENAVKHGALRRDGGGTVTMRAQRVGHGVRLVVEDNGPGFPPETPPGLGLGLGLVRQRLLAACPGATLTLEPSPMGTRAIIDVPEACP